MGDYCPELVNVPLVGDTLYSTRQLLAQHTVEVDVKHTPQIKVSQRNFDAPSRDGAELILGT